MVLDLLFGSGGSFLNQTPIGKMVLHLLFGSGGSFLNQTPIAMMVLHLLFGSGGSFLANKKNNVTPLNKLLQEVRQ